jgi:Flp pilus assembly protein TadG
VTRPFGGNTPVARRRTGQGLVEFALVLPAFLLIVLALFDTGKGVFTYNSLGQAAREGARLASVEVSWIGASGANCTAPVCPADSTALRSDVVAALNRMTVGLGAIPSANIFIHCHAPGTNTPASTASWNGCTSANTLGNVVTVRVDYTYQPIIGAFFRWATAGTMALTADTTMAIN